LWDLARDKGEEQFGIVEDMMGKEPIDEGPKTRKEEGQNLEKEGWRGEKSKEKATDENICMLIPEQRS